MLPLLPGDSGLIRCARPPQNNEKVSTEFSQNSLLNSPKDRSTACTSMRTAKSPHHKHHHSTRTLTSRTTEKREHAHTYHLHFCPQDTSTRLSLPVSRIARRDVERPCPVAACRRCGISIPHHTHPPPSTRYHARVMRSCGDARGQERGQEHRASPQIGKLAPPRTLPQHTAAAEHGSAAQGAHGGGAWSHRRGHRP